MSADLTLEDGYLEQLRGGFASAREVFVSAARDNSGIAGVVGDGTLEGRVGDFYEGWSKRRTELIDAVDALEQAVVAVAESFEQADAELARFAAEMP